MTAIHDSERFELYEPARHVPGSGRVEPGGTGYPPPATAASATTFAATGVSHAAAAATPVHESAAATPAASAMDFMLPPQVEQHCRPYPAPGRSANERVNAARHS